MSEGFPPPEGPPRLPPGVPPPPPYPPPAHPSATGVAGQPAWPAPSPAPAMSPAARRRRIIAAAGAGVLALGLVGTAATLSLVDDGRPVPRDLGAVRSYGPLPTTHLKPGEQRRYDQSPAVGGPHAPVWLDCGAYDRPLPEVNVVHDLEHGTVWITYLPDQLSPAGVKRLESLRPDNGILSPYPGQEAPVVVTVWGRQLALRGADDPRLPLFIDAFGAGQTAPEPLASCHGGADPDEVPGSGRLSAASTPVHRQIATSQENP